MVIGTPDAVSDRLDPPSVVLRLRLSRAFGARRVTLAGDLTAWTPVDMPFDGDGHFSVDVTVPPHRRWRYRFCLDDATWINDPSADDYELDADGSGISVRYS
jgi:1,4-alpha-glucan branching enzyme